jgi:uncharacterized SAM-binding protein YcdF (DUF218 family)
MADLYFWASKLIGFFLEPLHALGLLTALTLVTLSRWRPRARQIGVLCLLVSWGLLGALPLWHTLLGTLEQQKVRPTTLPDQIAGIIVLGGALDSGGIHQQHGVVALNSAAERMTEALTLMRIYPNVPVVFSGYSGELRPRGASEAHLALQFFDETWGSTDRILLEDQSRNTVENARYTEALIADLSPHPWLLVTSAFHMPRAHAIFSDTRLTTIPYPVDYRSMHPSDSRWFNLLDGATLATLLIHEWVGLTVYRVFQSD